MTDWLPTQEELQWIFDVQIRPVLFGDREGSNAPLLTLLTGQAGAGVSRATAGLLASSPADTVALNGDDLHAFHPHVLALSRSGSMRAPQILAESTAGWLRSCIAHARSERRSLLLDGAFTSPDVVRATADLFASHGFATRVAVVAMPRRESLLSEASRFLLADRSGRATRFTSVAEHDAGWVGTRMLVEQLEAEASIDRLTIIGRDGGTRFDAERSNVHGYSGAVDALDSERSAALSSARAMLWLSELRAATDYALTSGRMSKPVAEVLIELHQIALNEAVPALGLPADSQARPVTETRLAQQLVSLRRAIPAEPAPADLGAPTVGASQPERGIAR